MGTLSAPSSSNRQQQKSSSNGPTIMGGPLKGPQREISITKPEIVGGKNVHELFLGGVWEHFQPPSSSNNCKNTSKNSSSNPPARPPPARCCCCFCWCFCCCCCCWGAGSVPIQPPEIARGCFFPPAISGRDTYLPLRTIISKRGTNNYRIVSNELPPFGNSLCCRQEVRQGSGNSLAC